MNCEALLETLLLNRKKLRESTGSKVDSATFMAAGNVVRKAKTRQDFGTARRIKSKMRVRFPDY